MTGLFGSRLLLLVQLRSKQHSLWVQLNLVFVYILVYYQILVEKLVNHRIILPGFPLIEPRATIEITITSYSILQIVWTI